jgi:hypothetical protein
MISPNNNPSSSGLRKNTFEYGEIRPKTVYSDPRDLSHAYEKVLHPNASEFSEPAIDSSNNMMVMISSKSSTKKNQMLSSQSSIKSKSKSKTKKRKSSNVPSLKQWK